MAIYTSFNPNLNRPRPKPKAGGHVPGAFNAGGGGTAGGAPGTFKDETKPPAWWGIYNTAMAGAQNSANTAYTSSINDIVTGENRAANDYGATLTRDDSGNITGSHIDWDTVDANNPFSRAALLKRAYNQQQNRTTNGYASRGQLYSGAVLNARSSDLFGYQQGQDSLTKGLGDSLYGYGRERNVAAATRDSIVQNAGFDALKAALGI